MHLQLTLKLRPKKIFLRPGGARAPMATPMPIVLKSDMLLRYALCPLD